MFQRMQRELLLFLYRIYKQAKGERPNKRSGRMWQGIKEVLEMTGKMDTAEDLTQGPQDLIVLFYIFWGMCFGIIIALSFITT